MKLSLVRVLPLAIALLVPFVPASALADESGSQTGVPSKPHAAKVAHTAHPKRAKAAKPKKAVKAKPAKAPKAAKKAPKAAKKAAKGITLRAA
jgi:hypothetical protein